MTTSWKKEIAYLLRDLKEELIACTLSKEELNTELDSYSEIKPLEFTAWTKSYVFFPVVYDGSIWVGFSYRDPCNIPTEFQGGGL